MPITAGDRRPSTAPTIRSSINPSAVAASTFRATRAFAGASAVAVGTMNFVNPRAATDVIAGIESYLERHGVASVRELVGAVKLEG